MIRKFVRYWNETRGIFGFGSKTWVGTIPLDTGEKEKSLLSQTKQSNELSMAVGGKERDRKNLENRINNFKQINRHTNTCCVWYWLLNPKMIWVFFFHRAQTFRKIELSLEKLGYCRECSNFSKENGTDPRKRRLLLESALWIYLKSIARCLTERPECWPM